MKVTFKEGKWIATGDTFPYRNAIKNAGYRWDPVNRYWWTDKASVAYLLEKYFDGSARTRCEVYAKEATQKIEASRAMVSDIFVPCPEGLAYRPFQLAGIAYAFEREKTLIGDEMGIGKTIQAIGLINLTVPARVLVICPKSLKLNWQRELEKWLVMPYTIQRPKVKEDLSGDIVIINPDIAGKLREKIDKVEWDIMILDEFHFYKNPKTARTCYVLGGKIDGHIIPSISSKRTLMLTGTPIPNRPKELWTVLKYTKVFANFKQFALRYCAAYADRFGWNYDGASHLDELQNILREKIMIRRLKKDVLSELPPKIRQVIELENGGKDFDLSRFGVTDDNFEESIDTLLADHAFFTELSRIRHESGLQKVSASVEFVGNLLEENEKVFVACWHNDVAEMIAEGLKDFGVVLYNGKTSENDRNNAVESFQGNPKTRVFVGTMGSAGVGLTLTAANTVVMVESDWQPANLQQTEDRCHRIGQTDPVNVYYLVFENSIDRKILKTIIKKMDVQDRALDRKADPVKYLFDKSECPKVSRDTDKKDEKKDFPETQFTPEEIDGMKRKMIYLATVCDGARSEDGSGFNKFDSNFGKSLASRTVWTQKMAASAAKLVNKYRKQLENLI